jgi:4-amino-4-deoxy-L-arabinose transferase-like glycosyltransferase
MMESNKNEKIFLLIAVFVALGIRLVFMAYFEAYVIEDLEDTFFLERDPGRPALKADWVFGYETGRIAKAIATGEGFSSPFRDPSGPTAWLMPLYPYLLALIFKIFGVYTAKAAIAALTVNCIISAFTCIPLYYISKSVFGRETGYIAATAFVFYPPSVWHAINTIWDTTFYTFGAVLLIYWLYRLSKKFDYKNAALFGFLIGIVALVNAAILAFIPFALIWLIVKIADTLEKKLKSTAVLLLLIFLTLSPWLLRNYIVFDRIMLRSNFGLELKLGNNQMKWDAWESKKISFFTFALHPSLNDKEFQLYKDLGELNYIARCYNETMSFIKANAGRFLRITLKRISIFWLGDYSSKNDFTGNLKTYVSLSTVKKLCHVIPIPFMLFGIYLSIKRRHNVTPLLAFMLFIPLVYYITHVAERYRFPIEPIILIFASYGFYSLIWRQRKI